jgi:hypothetical protein
LLALTIYTYLAARLLPLVPLLFFITHWLLTRRSSASANYLRLLLYYLLFTGLFLLPLIIYFSLNPADFIARAGMVSVFNPAWNNGDPLGTFWRTFILTLSTFIGLSGDPHPLVNEP